ncbi:MAG: type VII toxin-antitoxin system MntA family adenylyltransferase antitoxin [Thermodesulfovibrionales bacterium]
MIDTKKLENIFKDYPYIASAYLFGSQALGKIGPMSDVDIAILLKEDAPKGRELIHEEDHLAYKITVALGVKEVDLIDLNSQRLIFRHNVLRTGKLIYDADPRFRISFEMRVITEFCDFEPTLKFIEKYHFKGRLRRCASL